ncbi:hypothetical protein GCM10010967_09140 [Dyadobacter beijingensis]|uniref:YaaC-like Protein n=1 Tax=Dyadobacter beijingensis TaxID=365489 RepID=A0ABQ2HH22_9BACT|nr:hypothetical protein [Dyadobacter beijingensis]GGM79591.1 hypothetical protein GCM10010967_09140 [Dyadobacter beijingensis]
MKPALETFIDRIEALQSKGNALFPKGIFPAQRSNTMIGYRRPDTTMFFSAITAFTLQSIRKYCNTASQKQIDAIRGLVTANYPDFQNKDGLKTYNFWKTKPSRHFPNGRWFRRFEHFRIPDDIDDTAFAYLTTDPTREELVWLKEKLTLHANGTKRWIRNTYPEYQPLRAYSTWFGKHMYVEFDISVLCNMLYCILHYNLPLNEHDDASLEYIRSVIDTRRYITAPFRCAHQYPRTPLIMYHAARLIAAFDPPALRSVKPQLLDDMENLLQTTRSGMDRVLLATSLMRFGRATQRIPVETYSEKDFKGFYFFIAGLLTAYENPVLYKLSVNPLVHMHWTCEAHCWALLAEYEALWNQQQPAGTLL